MGTAKLLSGTNFAWISLLSYLAGIVIGGLAGVLGGVLLGFKINRGLGLQQLPLHGITQKLSALRANGYFR